MISIGKTRTILREVLPTALLAVLLLTFMARTRHSEAPEDARDGWIPSSWGLNSSLDAAWETKLDELRTLPAYQEAEQALRDLEESRAALLKSAAASDADAMLAAGADYRRTLQRVRAKLSQLKDYLDPAEAGACLRDLVQQLLEGDPGDALVLEIRLGMLAGVSSW
jgi:hypothetical protein